MDLAGALSIIAACGGLGALVDFWIGKAGQKRVKGWLEDWWLRLSDVRWGNFGREEAAFAARAMDRLFGEKILSWRRLIAVMVIYLGVLVGDDIPRHIIHSWSMTVGTFIGPLQLVNLIMLAISFSLTRFLTATLVVILGSGGLWSLLILVIALGLQYVILCLWAPIIAELPFLRWHLL